MVVLIGTHFLTGSILHVLFNVKDHAVQQLQQVVGQPLELGVLPIDVGRFPIPTLVLPVKISLDEALMVSEQLSPLHQPLVQLLRIHIGQGLPSRGFYDARHVFLSSLLKLL
jgi:hypothetical protein